MKRRDFMKTASLTTLAFIATASAIPAHALKKKKKKGAAAAGDKMCKPGEGMAANLDYQTDKSKAKASNKITKQGVAFKDQDCKNCQLYTPEGNKIGKCLVLPNCKVEEAAWCMSWSKKV